MNDDPVLAAVQKFMDAVELRIAKQEAEARSLCAELRALRGELETRAAALPVAGPPGPAGRDGKDGAAGEKGEPGALGAPGAMGPQGEKGEKGERGADGLQGRDGAAGVQGAVGPAGTPGLQGDRGADGLAGRDGAVGPQGARGADGIATIEEIEAIVEQRAAAITVRTFADVYQGVFEPEKTYSRGLLATWGGSLWLSLNNTRSKPGEDGDWKLVVKRGADGRK